MQDTTFPNIPILYEDDDLLVINKPPGVVVNRSQTHKGLTIMDWMQERLVSRQSSVVSLQPAPRSFSVVEPSVSRLQSSIIFGDPIELFRERVGVVHRLDKDTSGVMLLAKNPDALVACMQQFKQRQTRKEYVALVHGKLQPEHAVIDLPIARNSKMRLQFAVREGGRESQTEYFVLQFFPHFNFQKLTEELRNDEKSAQKFRGHEVQGLSKNIKRASKIYQGFSLVRVLPKTGRTHQIRVHLAHLHHSIVGDNVYSGSKKRLIDQLWCERHFLHASSLKITHFRTNTELEFEAPLSEDLTKALGFVSE